MYSLIVGGASTVVERPVASACAQPVARPQRGGTAPVGFYDGVVSNAQPTYAATTSDLPRPHGLSTQIPKPLGDLLSTLVALVSIALIIWSLIATWSGYSGNGLPLFQIVVAGIVVSAISRYARSTLSWVVALIAGAAWVAVSSIPLIPILEVIAQTVTVTALVVGVNLALSAVSANKRPVSMFD